jgi:hypothetical protein
MKLGLIITLSIISQLAFGQKSKQIIFPPPVLDDMHYPLFTDACELPTHKNELVYTRFIYSGIDEYFGLRPEKKCNSINADLVIPDTVVIEPEYFKQLQDVHEHYLKKYLIVDVIGTFEDGNTFGYGHLGSNNSKFTIKYIIAAYTVNKVKKR